MRSRLILSLLVLAASATMFGKTVVFWQDGFPTIASQPITRETLTKALQGMDPAFAGIEALRSPATLTGVDLLVLPYGSAVPIEAWSSIQAYLRAGGNLLVLGGQPFRVPVAEANGRFTEARPQDTYSRELGFNHSYEIPGLERTRFSWKLGYSFLGTPKIRARRFFAMEGRGADGLGYMVNEDGVALAAPVIVADRLGGSFGRGGGANAVSAAAGAAPGRGGPAAAGSRSVFLDFEPEPGYWESADGISLVRAAANHALRGPTVFTTELMFTTIRPGETPEITARLRGGQTGRPLSGEVSAELVSGNEVLNTVRFSWPAGKTDAPVEFAGTAPLKPGFYTIRATYQDGGQPREFYQNGFWVEDSTLLSTGPRLGVHGDFLTRDDKPFFPFGTNYFTTDESGWEFGGPRNGWVWERDFAEMERHGVTFVRTGVWTSAPRFSDPATGGVTERFLRNLEAFLLSARRHNIIVNFNFWGFTPGPTIGAEVRALRGGPLQGRSRIVLGPHQRAQFFQSGAALDRQHS
jgi:hypothetical protein